MLQYLTSFFSLKKITHKGVSFFAIWDKKSSFTKSSILCRGAKINNSIIGRYVRVGLDVEVNNAVIGNFSRIGRNTIIGPGRHPMNLLTSHNIFYKKNKAWKANKKWVANIDFEEEKTSLIGNDVWVGLNCIIMDGVKIGDGAIIAAGSVVTKDVLPFSIVGGIPAKHIKETFPKEIQDRLLEIKWWDLPDEEITKRIDLFHKSNPTLDDINQYFY